jgi:choice-of-anchor B domain-containing protein
MVTESPINDVWGFVHEDEEYAVYGDFEQIFIYKILEKEPYALKVASMPRGEAVEFTKKVKLTDGTIENKTEKKVPNHSIWGEYRYYRKDGKAYLYASSEGFIHTLGDNKDNPALFPYLQIFDVTDIKNPKEIKVKDIHEGLRSIHNITLDEDRGILMAFGGTDHKTEMKMRAHNRKHKGHHKKKVRAQWKGARLYSLEDPANPKYIMTVGDTYVHDGQVKTTLDEKGNVLKTLVYLAQGSTAIHWDASEQTNEDNKIGVYDVTDLDETKTKVLLRKQYPYGYAHNIWATADDSHIVVTGETSVDNQLSFWKLETQGDGTLEAKFVNGLNLQGGSLAHNAFVDGNHIYLAHYTKGVQVAEIYENDLGVTDIRLVWAYDTYPKNNSGEMRGSWGVYPFGRSDKMFFATDSRTGFYIFKKLDRFMLNQKRD